MNTRNYEGNAFLLDKTKILNLTSRSFKSDSYNAEYSRECLVFKRKIEWNNTNKLLEEGFDGVKTGNNKYNK